jgi:lipopolysaccharide/colanic/teichoic acid biosynthesis glycosyltransferase
MNLTSRREYVALLLGDIIVFIASLWLTLALRYFEPPALDLFRLHLVPFSLLFFAWIAVFLLAGLYGRHTPLFRSKLLATIISAQFINIIVAALFLFLVPAFGIAPKTILVLYLFISSTLIFIWRVALYPKLRVGTQIRGVLVASGPDAKALAAEIKNGGHAFTFDNTIDTKEAPSPDEIERACRLAVESDVSFVVVDLSDRAVSSALPILYEGAFHKKRFALIDAVALYQEVFEREPLSLINYEWVLANIGISRLYDRLKRAIDVAVAASAGTISLLAYPFVALAIKLDDGGPIFITQARVGRYRKPINIVKFRSMKGNDNGNYGGDAASALKVTRVGRWLRMLRIDELPQLWNVFRGDLSLVGPRPELPAIAAHYSANIAYYEARYLVAPGLTGWAQLKHDRHPHHRPDLVETREKLSYDLYYLKHRSLLLDIFILLQTVRIVLTARGL